MSDPRLTLIRDGIAAASLAGLVRAHEFRETVETRCVAPVAAIRVSSDAQSQQQDQIVFGEAFDILMEEREAAFGQARRDGYVGWVDRAALAAGRAEPTHWVTAPSTFAFERPDLKSQIRMTLTMNCLTVVERSEGRYAYAADAGWVFEGHLAPIGEYLDDIAGVAEQFIGAPYQWGGREARGLDCSGLVQQALYACGRAGPRDSDMQAAALGRPIEGKALQRGDLVFWRGHVGVMLDEARLLHANAHHMATAIEPFDEAIARIREAAGEPTAFKRL